MNLNLKNSQDLPIVRQWIWLVFTPIITDNVTQCAGEEGIALPKGNVASEYISCIEKLLACKYGFDNDVISEYFTAQPCCILHPFQCNVYIFIKNSSSVEFRWQWVLFTSH